MELKLNAAKKHNVTEAKITTTDSGTTRFGAGNEKSPL
jgi:hypothetical protein